MSDNRADLRQAKTEQEAAMIYASNLVEDLRAIGATFCLREDGTFECDLNGIKNMTAERHERVANWLFLVRDEVRAILKAERMTH